MANLKNRYKKKAEHLVQVLLTIILIHVMRYTINGSFLITQPEADGFKRGFDCDRW